MQTAMVQCHLVKGDCLEITCDGMRWQIQSAFHEQARFRLDSHAMVHKALNVPTEHFKTGLKHQRLRTAFSWKHIWNLPAIHTLVIYKNIPRLNS